MSWDALDDLYPKTEQEPTWGDYGKAAGGGAAGIAAGTTGLLRQYFEAGQHPNAAGVFRELQNAARSVGDDIEGSMTPEGRERLGAGVTTDKFWEHPVSSLALKATGMTPYLLAGIGPGLLARGAGAATALATSGGASGWLAAGDVVDEITKKPDQMSLEQLRKESPLFAGFLDEGNSEREARDKLNQIMVGAKPAIAFLMGAATGVIGPGSQLVRGAAGAARHGFVRGALEGGATELAEEGYGAIAAQKSEIEGGLRKDYNQDEILDRALTGAVLGTGFGAVTSIGGGKGKAKADEIKAARAGEENAEVSAATIQEQIAARQESVPTKGTAKNQAVAVDPAVAEALAEKTQAPTPPAAAPEVPVPTPPPAAAAAQPPPQATPPVPPAAAAAPEAPQVPTPPPAAAPPQATAPSPPAAAPSPVTPQVTPPPLDEAMLTELARRGFTPEEAAQLTPEQIQQIVKQPVPGGSAQTPPAAPETPTDISARARTPEAQAAPVVDAPNSPPGITPTEAFTDPADLAAPAVNATGGRILQNISPEAQEKLAATQAAVQGNIKAAAAPVEKTPKPKKLANDYKAAQDERGKVAESVFAKHTADEGGTKLDIPKSRAERAALATRLKPLADEITSAMEPRDSLPDHILKHYSPPKGKKAGDFPVTKEEHLRYHRSLPGRIGANASPHVRYARELVDVQKLLEKNADVGPKSENYRRVLNFIAAHNEKAPDLITMSRKEAGDQIAASRRTAAQQEASETGTVAAKASVVTPQATGAASAPETLGANAKAAMGAEVLARIREREAAAAAAKAEFDRPVGVKAEVSEAAPAEISETPAPKEKLSKVEQAKAAAKTLADKYAAPAAPPKKPMPAGVAALVTKAKVKAEPKPEPKPEVTPEVTEDAAEEEPPRKVWIINDVSREGRPDMHEGAREAHAELNKIKAWVNGLSEADYNRLPEVPHRQMQDTNDIASVRRIAKWFEEEMGVNPLKVRQAEAKPTESDYVPPVAPRAAEVATKRRSGIPAKTKATPEQIKAARDAYAAQKAAKAAEGEASTIHKLSHEEKLAILMQSSEVRLETAEDREIWDTPIHKAADIFGHEDEDLSPPMRAADVLRNVDLGHLPDLPRYLQGFTRRRLIEVMGDTKVYFASDALVGDVTGDTKAPAGYYDPGGMANGADYIVLNVDALRSPDQYAHTVIHEAVHAALVRRLKDNPVFFNRIKTLAQELDKQLRIHGSRTDRDTARYGFSDPHEFVAEVMSNPKLQELMSKIMISPEVAERLGLPPVKKWTLWGAFTEKVRQMLGLPPGAHNFLHETMKVIAPEMQAGRDTAARSGGIHKLSMDALRDAAVGALPNANTRVNAAGKLALAKDKISTLWQMAKRGEGYFGPSNPLNRLFDLRAKMERAKDVILEKYGGLKATVNIARMERQYPELMAQIKDVAFRASLHDVNLDGSNDHLGKDRLMGVQAKNEVAALQREWNNPALNPVRPAIRAAMKFYKDIHNAVSYETIKNILAEANINDAALARRIHEDGLTDADREAWASTKLVNALDQVSGLKQRKGSFVPFRRYGDYISAAEHELSVPANAIKINDNTLQFVDPNPKNGTEYGDARARAAVKGYLRSNSHTPQGNKLVPAQIRQVWVDRNDQSKIVEGEDPNAIRAYRVAMQTSHVEMHATEAEAQNSKADLAQSGLRNARSHVREEAYKTETANLQGAMGQVLRSLEKQQRYIDADSTQKAAMREMFHDLTLGLSGTTSIKNSMRQRRNVAGMSHDLGRVTADYARMTANHLARMQYRPQMDSVFKEMRDYRAAHQYDNDAIRREQVYNEFSDRIYGKAATSAEEVRPGVVSRVMQLTRLSFLAGPSYHIINAHEPWTTSLAIIGGRHGFGASTRELTQAYSLIGGRSAAMAGLKDAARAYTDDNGFTDYVKMFKETIGKSRLAGPDKISRMQGMIDYLNERNLYSNTSIFEMAKYANPEGNIAGRAIDRADLMANQVGTAIEAINRTVTGLTAYNLEYRKNGGNHEAAMHYAYSTAHDTMGDYSSWNSAPVFNSKFGRPLLQFKKFPQKTYNLLGNIIGGALRGDRQAMKQFAGLMVTHGMIAGALGMPTEPFKLALLAANMVGATGFTPEDYEYAVRQLAARVAGQKGGEIISKGLYRGLGIELSGRTGLNDLLLRGTPKSNKDADIKSYLFDTMAGASGGYILNQVQGAQALMKGDVATAIEKMSPLRTVGDITKAVTGAMGDKKTDSGKVKQEQFGPWDATVRALGFTPSSQAEYGALRGTIRRESMQLSADRKEIIDAWIDASGAKKVAMQRAVQAFNANHDRDEQITAKDLSAAARRRATDAAKTKHGTTTSKRIKSIQDRAESVFNP